MGSVRRRGGGSKKIFMKIQLIHDFKDIISAENFLEAWKEFARGKRGRVDVQDFSFGLMDSILELRADLINHKYVHGGYEAFNISDPKPRDIHKASVRDRVVHHALYRVLYPFFDRTFIADSFSCRLGKGTHKALRRFASFVNKASRNDTRTCWVLKCDIRKFFANIDHEILLHILARYISDSNVLWLLWQVIDSFHTEGKLSVGLPLGNLTSQLFVNVYMNEFYQFVKHRLKAKYYLRYADDFAILSHDKKRLAEHIPLIEDFFRAKLRLELHPDKVFIKTLASGVDFLGWVNFPRYRVLRTATKRRMFKRLKDSSKEQSRASYFGMLTHGNAYKLSRKIEENSGSINLL